MTADLAAPGTLKVFLIAGEESGDALGAGLMQALVEAAGVPVTFSGVGGARMDGCGLTSLFPMEEIALHGVTAVLVRLPQPRCAGSRKRRRRCSPPSPTC